MKKIISVLLMIAVISLFTACGNGDAGKQKIKGDQDFSSSGMIKDIEEMNKAAGQAAPADQQPPPAPQKGSPAQEVKK